MMLNHWSIFQVFLQPNHPLILQPLKVLDRSGSRIIALIYGLTPCYCGIDSLGTLRLKWLLSCLAAHHNSTAEQAPPVGKGTSITFSVLDISNIKWWSTMRIWYTCKISSFTLKQSKCKNFIRVSIIVVSMILCDKSESRAIDDIIFMAIIWFTVCFDLMVYSKELMKLEVINLSRFSTLCWYWSRVSIIFNIGVYY